MPTSVGSPTKADVDQIPLIGIPQGMRDLLVDDFRYLLGFDPVRSARDLVGDASDDTSDPITDLPASSLVTEPFLKTLVDFSQSNRNRAERIKVVEPHQIAAKTNNGFVEMPHPLPLTAETLRDVEIPFTDRRQEESNRQFDELAMRVLQLETAQFLRGRI